MKTTAAILLTTLITFQTSNALADAGNFEYFDDDDAGRVDVSKCIKAAKKGVVLQQQTRKDGVIRNMYLLRDAIYFLRVDSDITFTMQLKTDGPLKSGTIKQVACHEYPFVRAKSDYSQ